MSKFQDDLRALKSRVCKGCLGLGECDDAHFGDIMFNTWPCGRCNKTGYEPEGTTDDLR